MKNFFTVILILAVSIFIFAIYYTGKSLYFRYKLRNINLEIQKKRYEDEKKYIRIYIRKLLDDLKSGNLGWIMIFSRLHPEARLELIYNSLKKTIQIQHRIRNISNEELETLKNLGLQTYKKRNDLYCIEVSLNSKIVTDIVYFVFENLNGQKNAQNIKIVTSGG